MEIPKFTDRLNCVEGNVYVVEEKVCLTDGVYEAELAHDNVREETLAVYTGSKLTGDKVDSFSLSTPSLMPWKRIIRVYSKEPVLYISYETEGDTVEADDVNQLQNSIVATQEAIGQENARAQAAEEALAQDIHTEEMRASGQETALEESLNQEMARAQEAETRLDEEKAGKEEVRLELENRYTKDQVYTKEEVLSRIEELIGAAPETLDTFKEIADALDNDPNFAATIVTMLGEKVDKETGKGLSSNDFTAGLLAKLEGMEEGANQYVHPDSSGHRHIPAGGSDGQILSWESDGTAAWTDKNEVYDAVLKGCTWDDLKGE